MTKKNKLIFIGLTIICVVILGLLFTFLNKKQVTYTVTFDSNGGTNIEEQIINQGDLIQKPKDPTKEGYVFIEWRYNNTLFDFSTQIEKDITLVAEWLEINEYVEMVTIKFNTDGGSTISNQVIEKDSKANKPTNPTKDGYTFIGWFYNDKEFSFDEKINENIELTAKWEKVPVADNNSNSNNSNTNQNNQPQTPTQPDVKTYTVTFNSNGGSGVAIQNITKGNKASKPTDPTRDGYKFESWTLNGVAYDFNSAVNGNITLIANWAEVVKNNYTVTFDSNGGSTINNQTIVEGNKASKPTDPTREGYHFAGWTLNGSSYDFDSVINGNITLTANWTQKSYNVVVNKVDNISMARILSVYEEGSPITVQTIQYSDGTTLCSGSNPNVNYYAIEGETSLKLVLNGGNIVTATLTFN